MQPAGEACFPSGTFYGKKVRIPDWNVFSTKKYNSSTSKSHSFSIKLLQAEGRTKEHFIIIFYDPALTSMEGIPLLVETERGHSVMYGCGVKGSGWRIGVIKAIKDGSVTHLPVLGGCLLNKWVG